MLILSIKIDCIATIFLKDFKYDRIELQYWINKFAVIFFPAIQLIYFYLLRHFYKNIFIKE
jgi:hypothetical protein